MRYNEEEALKALERGGVNDEGIEEAFQLLGNFKEEIINGKWSQESNFTIKLWAFSGSVEWGASSPHAFRLLE